MSGLLQTRLNQAAWLRVCVCLSFASLCVAARARALEPGFAHAPEGALEPATQLELKWTAPLECPNQESVRQRIEELLRGSANTDPTPVRAVGTVTRGRVGFRLTLTVKRGAAGGTRTLPGEDCAALSETAAFLVALSIDPNVPEGGAPVEQPPPAPEVKPVVVPEVPVEPKPVAPLSAAPAASIWSLQAGVFAGVWQTDRPAQPRLQLGGHVGFGWRMVDVELRYAFALPRDSTVSTGELRTFSQSFGLASCALFGGRFRAGPCGGVSLITTDAEPRQIDFRSPPRSVWAAVAVGAQAATEISKHIELFTEAGLSVPISQPTKFSYLGKQVVGTSFVGVYARLGLRFRYFIPPGLFHR